ncbi:glycine receptor subunit alpha-1 [Eurytemora carolleeae]|uniref:glycine receptor subunit alpha-1 n=1 Tax=Eurytemora carolleeae TaxID=1294199 RepID=UPI000C773294|nr:glycine receptor subunit alpha-1 [Eurytemora carolleeae]|eukprot:XP_023344754.1 glycine receptor subunit alpha-1-like [Eurytemora affinis]
MKRLLSLCLLILKFGLGRGRMDTNEDMLCKENGEINTHICLPRGYNKFDLPYNNQVNVIDIGIDITDVLRINDKEYSVEFSCYFNVMWKEPRLHIPEQLLEELNMKNSDAMFPVNVELVNLLWLPNVYIYNLKTFKVVEVLSKHAGLWITRNKEVMYSQATHINFICPMRFDTFPLDTQACKFQVGSYSYEHSKMIFTQTNKVQGYVKTANSVVLDYAVKTEPLKGEDLILDYGDLGNFSVAGFEMDLHRHVSHYLITYYLPSGLFVVVSWISFVVPPDVIPGRMALLITLFLVLVNIFNTVTSNTPKAEGLTAIEAWMLSCILFVFGALVEYAVILFQSQRGKPNPVQNHLKRHSRIICRENFKYEVSSENGINPLHNMLDLEEPKVLTAPTPQLYLFVTNSTWN